MYDNYNYPAGADTPDAPWNQEEVPEVEFNVTCSISLSKTVQVHTDDYIPECDDNGSIIEYNTSETSWSETYRDDHKTIPELLEELKKYIQKDLDNIDKVAEEQKHNKAFLKRKLEFLLEECDGWTVDEEDYEGEY